MANVAKLKDIIISAGGTYTVETLSNYQEANVTYSVSSIASNLVINPAPNAIGTIKGLRFLLHYDGTSVNFGNFTVSVFGTVMSNSLRNQLVLIDCFYDGFNWIVIFTPSYNTIVGLINPSNIVYYSSANLFTLNVSGPQTLQTFTLPKSLFKAGDRYVFKISGRYVGAVSKAITVEADDDTTVFNIWNQTVTYNNKDFYIEVVWNCNHFLNGEWSRIASQAATGESHVQINSANTNFPSIDFTVPWTMKIIGEEFTPSGGQVNIYSITVEKLLVP